MTMQATQIQYNYNMIEDYALTVWPPVAQNVQYSFLTLQNGTGGTPVTELLTVSDQNELLHFFRDSSAHSGWGQEQRLVDDAPDQPITKLIGFYQGDSLFVFAHYAVSSGVNRVIGMQKTPENGWAAMPMTPDLSNALGAMVETAMFTDAAGNVVVYGVSQNLSPPPFVMLAAQDGQPWDLVFESEAASGATYRLLPGQGGDQMTVVTLQGATTTFQGGSIIDGMFQWGSQPAVSHDLGLGDIAAQQVFAMPSQSNDPGFLLLSTTGTLYRIEDYLANQPTVTPMTGGANQPAGAQQVAIGLDSENRWMVFVIEATTTRLWLLRQSQGSIDAGGVTFNDWVLLGDELAAIACPPIMTAGPELFFCNLQEQVCQMAQDITGGSSTWFTTQLAVPAGVTANPAQTTTYTQELITQSNQGLPVPSSPVTLYADRKAVIVANGLSYHIGPNEPVLVESDGRGAVTIATTATALSAPSLGAALGSSFGAAGTAAWFRSDLRVHQRLAGQDPTFPMTGASLQAAGLLPATMSPSDADHAARTIAKLGAAAVNLAPTTSSAPRAAVPNVCFQLDFTQPGRLVWREVSTDLVGATAVRSAVGGWLSDIVGDVIHFFKHAVDEVKTITVSIVDGVASLAINGIAYALKTINDIVDGIELVLKKIATLFKEVIDIIKMMIEWLRMLFEWDDILRTHTVIKYYVNSVFTNLRNSDEQAVDLIQSQFSALQGKITNGVNQIGTVFGSQSFNAFISQQPGGSSSSLAAQSYRATFNGHAVRCNYALSKAQQHFAGATGLPASLAASVDSGPFANLLNMIQQQVAGLQNSTAKLQSLLQIQTSDPTKVFDLAAVGFLEAAAEVITFVLDVIEDIAVALLDLIGEAITALQSVLNADIDVPIISWLYKYVITGTIVDPGDDLTILDLLCLILAIPATILYKVLFGGANASAPFTSAQVNAITSSPIPWPTLSSTGAQAAPGTMTPTQEILLTLGGITYFLYAFCDMGIDVSAAAADGEQDPFATFLSWAGIVLGVVILGVTVPYKVMSKSENDWSEADKATLTYWAFGFGPILLNIAFAILSNVKAESRYFPVVGPIALSLFGAMSVGIGAWTTVEQALDSSYKNGWTETGNIIAPIPTSCAWLLPLNDATDGISTGFLVGIAAVCDFGALVTTVAGEATSS
ncbi:hypothetical protein W02_09000 [Nitrospira sp. KM1]|uniref:hypothetical protein n=1 Tax=Nitrospira sp. KM1 TaxID=1936990 RepID=UPI0013A7B48C|nr:hypothetical protein [Nitrospira sp. KM1]BCA53760.1 hypothetical protein W02_09000 [Nitrospira sp. KM1]